MPDFPQGSPTFQPTINTPSDSDFSIDYTAGANHGNINDMSTYLDSNPRMARVRSILQNVKDQTLMSNTRDLVELIQKKQIASNPDLSDIEKQKQIEDFSFDNKSDEEIANSYAAPTIKKYPYLNWQDPKVRENYKDDIKGYYIDLDNAMAKVLKENHPALQGEKIEPSAIKVTLNDKPYLLKPKVIQSELQKAEETIAATQKAKEDFIKSRPSSDFNITGATGGQFGNAKPTGNRDSIKQVNEFDSIIKEAIKKKAGYERLLEKIQTGDTKFDTEQGWAGAGNAALQYSLEIPLALSQTFGWANPLVGAGIDLGLAAAEKISYDKTGKPLIGNIIPDTYNNMSEDQGIKALEQDNPSAFKDIEKLKPMFTDQDKQRQMIKSKAEGSVVDAPSNDLTEEVGQSLPSQIGRGVVSMVPYMGSMMTSAALTAPAREAVLASETGFSKFMANTITKNEGLTKVISARASGLKNFEAQLVENGIGADTKLFASEVLKARQAIATTRIGKALTSSKDAVFNGIVNYNIAAVIESSKENTENFAGIDEAKGGVTEELIGSALDFSLRNVMKGRFGEVTKNWIGEIVQEMGGDLARGQLKTSDFKDGNTVLQYAASMLPFSVSHLAFHSQTEKAKKALIDKAADVYMEYGIPTPVMGKDGTIKYTIVKSPTQTREDAVNYALNEFNYAQDELFTQAKREQTNVANGLGIKPKDNAKIDLSNNDALVNKFAKDNEINRDEALVKVDAISNAVNAYNNAKDKATFKVADYLNPKIFVTEKEQKHALDIFNHETNQKVTTEPPVAEPKASTTTSTKSTNNKDKKPTVQPPASQKKQEDATTKKADKNKQNTPPEDVPFPVFDDMGNLAPEDMIPTDVLEAHQALVDKRKKKGVVTPDQKSNAEQTRVVQAPKEKEEVVKPSPDKKEGLVQDPIVADKVELTPEQLYNEAFEKEFGTTQDGVLKAIMNGDISEKEVNDRRAKITTQFSIPGINTIGRQTDTEAELTAQSFVDKYNIPFQTVKTENLPEMLGQQENFDDVSGFFHNGKVNLVEGKQFQDTPMHEFAHPLVNDIFANKPEVFNKVYDDLYETEEGKAIIAEVEKQLPLGSDNFKKEVVTTAVGLQSVALREAKKNRTFSQKFKDWFKSFWNEILNAAGIKADISKFDENTTLKDIVEFHNSNRQVNLDKKINTAWSDATPQVIKNVAEKLKIETKDVSQLLNNYDLTPLKDKDPIQLGGVLEQIARSFLENGKLPNFVVSGTGSLAVRVELKSEADFQRKPTIQNEVLAQNKKFGLRIQQNKLQAEVDRLAKMLTANQLDNLQNTIKEQSSNMTEENYMDMLEKPNDPLRHFVVEALKLAGIENELANLETEEELPEPEQLVEEGNEDYSQLKYIRDIIAELGIQKANGDLISTIGLREDLSEYAYVSESGEQFANLIRSKNMKRYQVDSINEVLYKRLYFLLNPYKKIPYVAINYNTRKSNMTGIVEETTYVNERNVTDDAGRSLVSFENTQGSEQSLYVQLGSGIHRLLDWATSAGHKVFLLDGLKKTGYNKNNEYYQTVIDKKNLSKAGLKKYSIGLLQQGYVDLGNVSDKDKRYVIKLKPTEKGSKINVEALEKYLVENEIVKDLESRKTYAKKNAKYWKGKQEDFYPALLMRDLIFHQMAVKVVGPDYQKQFKTSINFTKRFSLTLASGYGIDRNEIKNETIKKRGTLRGLSLADVEQDSELWKQGQKFMTKSNLTDSAMFMLEDVFNDVIVPGTHGTVNSMSFKPASYSVSHSVGIKSNGFLLPRNKTTEKLIKLMEEGGYNFIIFDSGLKRKPNGLVSSTMEEALNGKSKPTAGFEVPISDFMLQKLEQSKHKRLTTVPNQIMDMFIPQYIQKFLNKAQQLKMDKFMSSIDHPYQLILKNPMETVSAIFAKETVTKIPNAAYIPKFHKDVDLALMSYVRKNFIKKQVNGDYPIIMPSVFEEDINGDPIDLKFITLTTNGKDAGIQLPEVAVSEKHGLKVGDFAIFARIPSDKQSSFFVGVVKHTLPANYGNVVMVPKEFLSTSGTDFDGDNVVLWTSSRNKGFKNYDKIKKYVPENLQDKLRDVVTTGKYNYLLTEEDELIERTFHAVIDYYKKLNQLDKNLNATTAADIKTLFDTDYKIDTESEINNITNITTSSTLINDGKASLGIRATDQRALNLLGEAIKLTTPINILGSMETEFGNVKNVNLMEVNSAMTNAAVDTVKQPEILASINYNLQTARAMDIGISLHSNNITIKEIVQHPTVQTFLALEKAILDGENARFKSKELLKYYLSIPGVFITLNGELINHTEKGYKLSPEVRSYLELKLAASAFKPFFKAMSLLSNSVDMKEFGTIQPSIDVLEKLRDVNKDQQFVAEIPIVTDMQIKKQNVYSQFKIGYAIGFEGDLFSAAPIKALSDIVDSLPRKYNYGATSYNDYDNFMNVNLNVLSAYQYKSIEDVETLIAANKELRMTAGSFDTIFAQAMNKHESFDVLLQKFQNKSSELDSIKNRADRTLLDLHFLNEYIIKNKNKMPVFPFNYFALPLVSHDTLAIMSNEYAKIVKGQQEKPFPIDGTESIKENFEC